MIADITPDVMNTKLKELTMPDDPETHGFVSGGFYVWGAFTQLFGIKEKATTTPYKLTDKQIREIQDALDKGYPVMCGIDSQPEDADYDMHFVLLTDYMDEEFIIADPWTGTIRSLDDYLYGTKKTARETIEQYIIYELPEETTVSVELENLKKKLQDMRENRDSWVKKSEEYKEDLNNARKSLAGMEKEIIRLNAYIATYETPISEFSTKQLLQEILVRLGLRVPKGGDNL
jgi:regulator of replication initiation timing